MVAAIMMILDLDIGYRYVRCGGVSIGDVIQGDVL